MIGLAVAIGAALGYAHGAIMEHLFPARQLSLIIYALVADLVHAPVFIAMMILEMTNNYGSLAPAFI